MFMTFNAGSSLVSRRENNLIVALVLLTNCKVKHFVVPILLPGENEVVSYPCITKSSPPVNEAMHTFV